MTNSKIDPQIIELFLDSFEKFYTFLRPHNPITCTAIKTVGGAKKGIVEGNRIQLNMWQSSALIIVSLLTDNGKKLCLQEQLEGVFSWKYENNLNKIKDAKGALNVLEAIGFIERDRVKDPKLSPDRRQNTVKLTNEGKKFIKELRKSREKDVHTIINNIGVIESENYPYEKVALALLTVANNLWGVVLKDSQDLQKQEKMLRQKEKN